MEKKERLSVRVSSAEKEMVRKKAEEKNTTITALILKSIENNITVNLDTSDYRDLVIQTRRIGNNINTLLRRIHTYEFYEDTDITTIENSLKEIERLIEDERKTINNTVKEFENLTPRKTKKMFENMNKEIPLYLIYDEIVDHINQQLISLLDLMKKYNFEQLYFDRIEYFIEELIPTDYEYDELVKFSNELDKAFYKIDQQILIETGEFTENDFMEIVEILIKYKKESD